ncbi:MAG: hypothetical protein JXA96_18070 [Sedimentisphaerales bacterium]|nr:hypothetical protein [Sedimentisphaerales bacterium]
MYRSVTFSLAILLLLTFTASANDIGQSQQFAVNSINIGSVTGASSGSVASFNTAPINTVQTLLEDGGGTTYMQVSSSSLSQAAVTVGMYGDYGFEQNAVTAGTQNQSSLPGYFSLGTQNQSLGAVFSQNTINNGAFGATIGTQNFIGSGGQVITTPYGVNVSFVAVGVDSTAGVLVNRSLTINRAGL